MGEKGELTKLLNTKELRKDTINEWDKLHVRVPKKDWDTLLVPGLYVKYETKDGKLRLGGVINYHDPTEPYFSLLNPKNGVTWSVQKKNTRTIWAVVD